MGHIVSPWEANDILDKFRLSMQGKPSRKICSSLDNVRMTLTLIFFQRSEAISVQEEGEKSALYLYLADPLALPGSDLQTLL